MEVTASRFFIPENAVTETEGLDYGAADLLIRTAEALSQTIYQSVYIIDYLKQGFLYVSDNPLFLCGHTREEVLGMGYDFYMQHIPADELDMLVEINAAGFRFFNEIQKEERLGYSISYDFHLLSEEEKAILLLSAQGLKMEEIADRIFKSVDTVKFYKRRLFEKLGVKNITEALSFATNYRLI